MSRPLILSILHIYSVYTEIFLCADDKRYSTPVALLISAKIAAKLAQKHNVTREDIEQCFATRSKGYLRDIREEHHTNPPTLWFISETYNGRKLKVVFIQVENDLAIKTAFEPSGDDNFVYNKYAK